MGVSSEGAQTWCCCAGASLLACELTYFSGACDGVVHHDNGLHHQGDHLHVLLTLSLADCFSVTAKGAGCQGMFTMTWVVLN